MSLRAYLVDDEPLALKRLAGLLKKTNRVSIVGRATDPEIALNFLGEETVDVLLLDIQMPGMNGFELLARLPTRLAAQPAVIFTTAYDEYALRAFKVNSIDYLLKPVDPQELDSALDKLERLRGAAAPDLQTVIQQLAVSFRSAPAAEGFPDRIASRVGGRTQFVELSKVTHFQAEEKLTFAVTAAKKCVVDYSIAELEQKLDPRRFVRIHRSALLNLAYVEEIHSWFGGRVLVRLKGDKAADLTVARDRVRILKKTLGL